MARKQSSPELSSLACEVLNDPKATEREKRLAGSILSQDETKGNAPMNEDEARALFPEETVEFNVLSRNRDMSAKRRAIAAVWMIDGEQLRQSIVIPDGPHGLSAAAHTLRDHIDAMKGAK